MKQKIVRRASALVLAGCLLAGAALPILLSAAGYLALLRLSGYSGRPVGGPCAKDICPHP